MILENVQNRLLDWIIKIPRGTDKAMECGFSTKHTVQVIAVVIFSKQVAKFVQVAR